MLFCGLRLQAGFHETGVATLIELAGKNDKEKMKAPSFLMVLTGIGEYPYAGLKMVYSLSR